MKATNSIAQIHEAKPVGLIHVLANQGIYSVKGKGKSIRVVTLNSNEDIPSTIFVDEGRVEPLNPEFWEGEEFILTNESLSVTIK